MVYGGKGNIFRQKRERSFLRNCFVFCEYISQSYNFPLQKPFAMTLLMEFATGYLESHRGLWWKRKYPEMKTGKKLSEKLLCDVWLPLLALFLWNLKTDISDPFEDYIAKEISSDQNENETLWETSVLSVNSSHRVTDFPSTSLSLWVLLWNLQSDIWKPMECYGEKGNILR